MTTRSIPIGTLRQCRHCHAPAVDPFPDTWTLDLIKEGPASGPVAVFYTPHTDACTAPAPNPQPGHAVRVSGRYVTNLTVTVPPPVPRPRFATGGYIPTGATTWQPDNSDPIADLRAAQQAIENEPDRPQTTYLTGRAYRTMREIMDRISTDRANRRNINGLLYYAPISTDPPTTGDSGWTTLGYTDGGLAFNDDGQYIPATPPDLGPDVITEPGTMWTGPPRDAYADRPDHIHWADPTLPRRREADEAIYGGPPADPEPDSGPAAE